MSTMRLAITKIWTACSCNVRLLGLFEPNMTFILLNHVVLLYNFLLYVQINNEFMGNNWRPIRSEFEMCPTAHVWILGSQLMLVLESSGTFLFGGGRSLEVCLCRSCLVFVLPYFPCLASCLVRVKQPHSPHVPTAVCSKCAQPNKQSETLKLWGRGICPSLWSPR